MPRAEPHGYLTPSRAAELNFQARFRAAMLNF